MYSGTRILLSFFLGLYLGCGAWAQELTQTAEPSGNVLHLDLKETIAAALGNSPNLEGQLSKIRQAQNQVDRSYSVLRPTVDFSAQYSRIFPTFSSVGFVEPPDNYQFTLTIKQVLSTFGRLHWDSAAAKLAKRAEQERYRVETNSLVLLVAQRYIEALVAEERVSIAKDEFQAQVENLKRSRLLFTQGVVAKFDVYRTASEAAQSQQKLLEAETDRELKKARILSLLGEKLQRGLKLEVLPVNSPEALRAEYSEMAAIQSRPDLQVLRWSLEEARAKVESAHHSNNPRLELQNQSINRNAAGFSRGFSNTTALVLSIPLYDGGLSRLQAADAQEAVTQLEARLEEAERAVLLELREARKSTEDSWRAIEVAQESLRHAEEALRVAGLRYQNGLGTNLELLDAQSAHSRAKFGVADARAKYQLAQWSLWHAAGRELAVLN